MALFALAVKGWLSNAHLSPATYLIGIVLFIFLAIQCTLISGSLKIIDTIDEYQSFFSNIVNDVYDGWEKVTETDADVVIQKAIDKYPLLSYYISGGEFSGYSARELPEAIADELRGTMWAYIGRRLLWCIGFVIAASLLGIKTISTGGSYPCGTSSRKSGSLTTNYRDDVF